jgi:hypothetical protein
MTSKQHLIVRSTGDTLHFSGIIWVESLTGVFNKYTFIQRTDKYCLFGQLANIYIYRKQNLLEKYLSESKIAKNQY